MSSTVCDDHQLHNMKLFKDIEIPPRKQLLLSPPNDSAAVHLHKYLPSRDEDDETDRSDSADPYSTDHFRMYEFKVRLCTISRSHDWTACPFAHPGEKARRRDPHRFRYCSTVCPEFRRGPGCPRGDGCEFAHGVFECWLHPTRYRTEACKDGKHCKRKVCFFAHSPRELRILPELSPKYKNSGSDHCSSPVSKNSTHCCLFCGSVSSPCSSSPTSTLLDLSHFLRSPSLSPPISPVKQQDVAAGFSPISRYDGRVRKLTMSYKDILSELVSSLEGMGMSQEVCSPTGGSRDTNLNLPLLDLCFNGDNHHHQDEPQLVLSPEYSTRIPGSGSGDSFKIFEADHNSEDCWYNKMNNYENGLGNSGSADPDLGWVNDLLM